jgi:hypothetical protein
MADNNQRSRQQGEKQKAGKPGAPRHGHSEREELIRNPDLNQADNSRGSLDQTQGSQTGNEIDEVPEP